MIVDNLSSGRIFPNCAWNLDRNSLRHLFRNWDCEELEVSFRDDYYNWAQRWYIIAVEPDHWRLVYEGLDEERSVTLEFRVSDEWEAYYAKYAVDSPPLRERQLAFSKGC